MGGGVGVGEGGMAVGGIEVLVALSVGAEVVNGAPPGAQAESNATSVNRACK